MEFFWQRNRDSNPNIQSQSLLCYRYTIPLFCACLFYHNNFRLSSLFCSKFYLFAFIVFPLQKSKAFLLDFRCCLCYTYIKLHLCPTNRQHVCTLSVSRTHNLGKIILSQIKSFNSDAIAKVQRVHLYAARSFSEHRFNRSLVARKLLRV